MCSLLQKNHLTEQTLSRIFVLVSTTSAQAIEISFLQATCFSRRVPGDALACLNTAATYLCGFRTFAMLIQLHG